MGLLRLRHPDSYREADPRNDNLFYLILFRSQKELTYMHCHCEPDEGERGNLKLPSIGPPKQLMDFVFHEKSNPEIYAGAL